MQSANIYDYMKKSDERFESILQELRAFREDADRKFEAVDKRFEEVYRRFDMVDSNSKDLKDWV